jgi:serine/threonine protein kinase
MLELIPAENSNTNTNTNSNTDTGLDDTTMNTLIKDDQQDLSIPGFLLVAKQEEAFRKRSKIGHGGASVVFLADPLDEDMKQRLDQLRMPRKIVVKEFRKSSMNNKDIEVFRQELAIMWLLNLSLYTAKLIGYGEDPFFMAMPFYSLGDLSSYLSSERSIGKPQRLRAVLDIARGLRDIHHCGIAHLDMKPDNILLHGDAGSFRCHITDFGISTVVSKESMTVDAFNPVYRRGFTVAYAAPEIVSRKPMVSTLRSSDIYSFAVIIKAVLTRRMPWMEVLRP